MMTPEAKSKLSQTIRALRERLLDTLTKSIEGEYLLTLSVEEAHLDSRRGALRTRLEDWLDEQARAAKPKEQAQTRERALLDVAKEAGYTWLNRLLVIRLLETHGHIKEKIVTGGWGSRGYKAWRQCAGPLANDTEDQGYLALLDLLFDELATHMPGLFGEVGLVQLVPMPPVMLREMIEALDDPDLATCWHDDTTLGWVYQYWNDPEREALDAKLNSGGKVEPHEIASKTQMFTEQYMVEWLLQNSLGQMWLAICAKNQWTPLAKSSQTLDRLDARRAQWRQKRHDGEVALDELMPIEGALEEQWKYWIPQPLPQDSIDAAPGSIRDIKLLDPACGSGHFLVGAFSLLFAFYKEEAHHRGETWSDLEIAEQILSNNLHGIDIDPRAVQIAAAALLLTASNACGQLVHPDTLHLVAPNLQLATLPKDDPALTDLTHNLHHEAGLPHELIEDLLATLKGADHLGSLLKVDVAISDIIARHLGTAQTNLFSQPVGLEEDSETLRTAILSQLHTFLAAHASGADLGLRLRGEQLANGIRFLQLIRPDSYDIVIGNPPYQGTSKIKDASYVKKHYPHSKADLFACFLERGLQLAKTGGVSAMLTMRNWMFIKQYQSLRQLLLANYDLPVLCDLDSGAFEEISAAQVVVSVAMTPFWKRTPSSHKSIAIRPTPQEDKVSYRMIWRKRAGVLAHDSQFEFQTQQLHGIEGWPLIYWWDDDFLKRYTDADKIGKKNKTLVGLRTSNNTRFVRQNWEINHKHIYIEKYNSYKKNQKFRFAPYIKGAQGRSWIEPLKDITLWTKKGMEYLVCFEYKYDGFTSLQNESYYFKQGIAFSMIGNSFSGRIHRYKSIIGHKGSSIYSNTNNEILCIINSSVAKTIMESLNPGVGFEAGDVNRLPVWPIEKSDEIYEKIEGAFDEHEAGRENSVEFVRPGESCWEYAQQWAQRAVDREEGEDLPDWEPEYVAPTAQQWVSWAVGVALGRFDREQGLVEDTPEGALPAGILFVSEVEGSDDGLAHPACDLLHAQWDTHGKAINEANSTKAKEDLNTWLRKRFFSDVHRQMYENAPIYFPLSSAKKSFVAFVSIHRWTPDTLRILQADWLLPEKTRIEGQIADLRAIDDDSRSRQDDKQLDKLTSWLAELEEFIETVNQCAEFGPPRPDAKTPEREQDARYEPVLDDGTMINSSALWPLLDPQWNYPKKWWKELALAKGRKDYDWSLLAARYFPSRVDDKCKQDPSLAVAHACFWKYHPEKAYAWELRLQDELDDDDFSLDEPLADASRTQFLAQKPDIAAQIEEDEQKRRDKKQKKQDAEDGDDADNDIDEDGDDDGDQATLDLE